MAGSVIVVDSSPEPEPDPRTRSATLSSTSTSTSSSSSTDPASSSSSADKGKQRAASPVVYEISSDSSSSGSGNTTPAIRDGGVDGNESDEVQFMGMTAPTHPVGALGTEAPENTNMYPYFNTPGGSSDASDDDASDMNVAEYGAETNGRKRKRDDASPAPAAFTDQVSWTGATLASSSSNPSSSSVPHNTGTGSTLVNGPANSYSYANAVASSSRAVSGPSSHSSSNANTIMNGNFNMYSGATVSGTAAPGAKRARVGDNGGSSSSFASTSNAAASSSSSVPYGQRYTYGHAHGPAAASSSSTGNVVVPSSSNANANNNATASSSTAAATISTVAHAPTPGASGTAFTAPTPYSDPGAPSPWEQEQAATTPDYVRFRPSPPGTPPRSRLPRPPPPLFRMGVVREEDDVWPGYEHEGEDEGEEGGVDEDEDEGENGDGGADGGGDTDVDTDGGEDEEAARRRRDDIFANFDFERLDRQMGPDGFPAPEPEQEEGHGQGQGQGEGGEAHDQIQPAEQQPVGAVQLVQQYLQHWEHQHHGQPAQPAQHMHPNANNNNDNDNGDDDMNDANLPAPLMEGVQRVVDLIAQADAAGATAALQDLRAAARRAGLAEAQEVLRQIDAADRERIRALGTREYVEYAEFRAMHRRARMDAIQAGPTRRTVNRVEEEVNRQLREMGLNAGILAGGGLYGRHLGEAYALPLLWMGPPVARAGAGAGAAENMHMNVHGAAANAGAGPGMGAGVPARETELVRVLREALAGPNVREAYRNNNNNAPFPAQGWGPRPVHAHPHVRPHPHEHAHPHVHAHPHFHAHANPRPEPAAEVQDLAAAIAADYAARNPLPQVLPPLAPAPHPHHRLLAAPPLAGVAVPAAPHAPLGEALAVLDDLQNGMQELQEYLAHGRQQHEQAMQRVFGGHVLAHPEGYAPPPGRADPEHDVAGPDGELGDDRMFWHPPHVLGDHVPQADEAAGHDHEHIAGPAHHLQNQQMDQEEDDEPALVYVDAVEPIDAAGAPNGNPVPDRAEGMAEMLDAMLEADPELNALFDDMVHRAPANEVDNGGAQEAVAQDPNDALDIPPWPPTDEIAPMGLPAYEGAPRLLAVDRAPEAAPVAGPSNAARTLGAGAAGNGAGAASSSAKPVDPIDGILPSIIEVVPDVLPEHAASLAREHVAAFGKYTAEHVIGLLFENGDYPKRGKGKKKDKGKAKEPAKRAEDITEVNAEDIESADKAIRRLLLKEDRTANYLRLALFHLRESYPQVPIERLRLCLKALGYARAHQHLSANVNRGAGAIPLHLGLVERRRPAPYGIRTVPEPQAGFGMRALLNEFGYEQNADGGMENVVREGARGDLEAEREALRRIVDQEFVIERRLIERRYQLPRSELGTPTVASMGVATLVLDKGKGKAKDNGKGKGKAKEVSLGDEEEEPVEEGMGVECQCCYSEFAFSRMAQCPDAHLFCISCISQYASVQLGNMDPSLVCMHPDGCATPFTELELRRVLPKKLMRLYERVHSQKAVEGLDGLEACPFCDWKCVIDAPPEVDKLFRCGNVRTDRDGDDEDDDEDECGAISCRLCKKLDHRPKNCKEAEEDKHLDGQHAIEEAMTAALTRNCPKCKKPIIKEGGCNKMTCPYCRTHFCYTCRKEITGYDHFDQRPLNPGEPVAPGKCRTHDLGHVEAMHANEVAAAAKKALAEYKEAHPDADDTQIKIDIPEAPPAPPRHQQGLGRLPNPRQLGLLDRIQPNHGMALGAFPAVPPLMNAQGAQAILLQMHRDVQRRLPPMGLNINPGVGMPPAQPGRPAGVVNPNIPRHVNVGQPPQAQPNPQAGRVPPQANAHRLPLPALLEEQIRRQNEAHRRVIERAARLRLEVPIPANNDPPALIQRRDALEAAMLRALRNANPGVPDDRLQQRAQRFAATQTAAAAAPGAPAAPNGNAVAGPGPANPYPGILGPRHVGPPPLQMPPAARPLHGAATAPRAPVPPAAGPRTRYVVAQDPYARAIIRNMPPVPQGGVGAGPARAPAGIPPAPGGAAPAPNNVNPNAPHNPQQGAGGNGGAARNAPAYGQHRMRPY